MTQKTKLEIIGEYSKDHPGPFAIDSAKSAEVLYVKTNVHCVVNGIAFVTTEDVDGPWCSKIEYIMCAREVPEPREFWVNEYHGGNRVVYDSPEKAQEFQVCLKRTIHMIEVLPGEGA
ncbi:hypothetical protein AD952_09230 [Acetobacter cerevisiae]|uniref:Phage protein n=1 Tax=Acetobacter cerevisiae TaxID=178900 RepID=A0A149UTZ5_9PROT|nr:hypothetical protein [Acetobacter cerevisiae]KXV71398.1 hypothetical protein AD952_09230 [Acetobacter cerevisiae]